ncbi:MAG: hypothetical protein Aureis2KO_08830 [Aureisphaera sp.]
MEENILAAIIGGLTGAVISLVSSYVITKLKINQEVKIWNTEFAVNYSKLLFESPQAAQQLARQFAIGLIVVRDQEGRTASKHFIPYQCKVAIGRKLDNDIVIEDPFVSRDHGIFFYRGNKVYFQLLSPLNKTYLNEDPIDKICELHSGDKLLLGQTTVEFEELK